jgi:hypothetical protein
LDLLALDLAPTGDIGFVAARQADDLPPGPDRGEWPLIGKGRDRLHSENHRRLEYGYEHGALRRASGSAEHAAVPRASRRDAERRSSGVLGSSQICLQPIAEGGSNEASRPIQTNRALYS